MAFVQRGGAALMNIAQTFSFARFPWLRPAQQYCGTNVLKVVFGLKNGPRYDNVTNTPFIAMLLYDDKSGPTNECMGCDAGDF